MKKHLMFLLALLLGSTLGTWAVAPTANAASCTDPRFVTTDQVGMWNDGKYIVHNNMWNASSYRVSQKLSACSYGNWRVTATADNRSGDGAVKTYPNVHRDYRNWSTGWEPRVSSFRTIRSSWAARTPDVGIYNAAYDIWLSPAGGGDRLEVMVWTRNHKQVPTRYRFAKGVKLSNHRWSVWLWPENRYIAFVPKRPIDRGTLDIKAMLGWLMKRGKLARDVTLSQVCFGFEIVSTQGRPATFKVDRFNVTSSRR